MKRGGPIARRTELQRTGLKRASITPHRVHLRSRSRKGAAEDRERGKVLRAMFPEPVVCAVPDCGQVATDPHEPLTRARGGSVVDPANIVGICRRHHSEIHAEPPWAYELGLLRHSWEAS